MIIWHGFATFLGVFSGYHDDGSWLKGAERGVDLVYQRREVLAGVATRA